MEQGKPIRTGMSVLFFFKTTGCVFRFRQSSRLLWLFCFVFSVFGFLFFVRLHFLLQFNQEKDSGSAGFQSDWASFLLSLQNLKRTPEPDDSVRSSSCDVSAVSCCFRLLTLFPVSHFLLAASYVWSWVANQYTQIEKKGFEFIRVLMLNCCHRP